MVHADCRAYAISGRTAVFGLRGCALSGVVIGVPCALVLAVSDFAVSRAGGLDDVHAAIRTKLANRQRSRQAAVNLLMMNR